MYNYVYIIYAFVKFLDVLPVIIFLSCHPGKSLRGGFIAHIEAHGLQKISSAGMEGEKLPLQLIESEDQRRFNLMTGKA